jgi:hypothetical protein
MLANRASPSGVPAAPPAVTSTRSQSGTKQQPAACCRALLLVVSIPRFAKGGIGDDAHIHAGQAPQEAHEQSPIRIPG